MVSRVSQVLTALRNAKVPTVKLAVSPAAQVSPKLTTTEFHTPFTRFLWFHQNTPRYSLICPEKPSFDRCQSKRCGLTLQVASVSKSSAGLTFGYVTAGSGMSVGIAASK